MDKAESGFVLLSRQKTSWLGWTPEERTGQYAQVVFYWNDFHFEGTCARGVSQNRSSPTSDAYRNSPAQPARSGSS